ncbi:NADH-ubiquinone oxidoreductase-F iron-sulfur binding region domain-containing protein [Natranaerobius trueperi]|uniref:NADH-quinone oxidoreductase subunit F n=1 Tax=Natranaerobius trueperi TaxID=759412 RepID=A0A226BYU0_9FIRM|nr:NADH-ubiquinone oxidoreductase-F iron-sulfur binding region domain-containing protein [Natranaerobius trueperi]OWZ83277.1 NADH-quinone oxidoreductase subunit F [Natranaerobius trueperi]
MESYRSHVLICGDTGCNSSDSPQIQEKFTEELEKNGLTNEVKLIITGYHGLCELAPIVIVYPEGTSYFKVSQDDVSEIVEEHLLKGRTVDRLMYHDRDSEEKIPYYNEIDFYKQQERIVLRNCGYINPDSINEYIAQGGYEGLAKALVEFEREEVTEEVIKSNLRGRGGAGFPTGEKWKLAGQEPAEPKYMVCNADEGDPGAFIDRSILEGDPHSVIEGMVIAGYVIGAEIGYVYVRAECQLAVRRLRMAIEQAEQLGLLGENILGTGVNFTLKVVEGAGAFVCGESTALTRAIEGRRGMPRPTPPRSTEQGLWGKPTVVNNVETLACVPYILANGADWFTNYGTPKSPGTKVFALTGKVKNTGLVEVPMGTSIRDIVFDIGGGGIQQDNEIKAVQIGGPSGFCLPEDKLDLPVEFDTLDDAGAMMGSGGLVVMDEETCVVNESKLHLKFIQSESCGKCTPCREGTKRMLEILERITEGKGRSGDIELMKELGDMIINTSLCGLGKSAPNPVLSTLRCFEDEYKEHLENERCPAGVCSDLVKYQIVPDNCIGCTACARVCPVDAISGEKKQPHEIDPDKCIGCGECLKKCKFEAVVLG